LISVDFEYLTGLRREHFRAARLSGSWNEEGFASDQWTTVPMQPFTGADGCPAFRATVQLDDSQIGQRFRWGVFVDTPQQNNVWGIATEVNDSFSRERYRTFLLQQDGQAQRYYFTHCRRLGANKLYIQGQNEPAIRFAVWAPNAQNVELVRGEVNGNRPDNLRGGYISNNGEGISAVIPMHREEDGIWATRVEDDPVLRTFGPVGGPGGFDHTPYMYRITKDDGSVAYRTDLYTRCQIGNGDTNPATAPWSGLCRDLDAGKSCSVALDPEWVTELVNEGVWPETRWVSVDDFWQSEYVPDRPVPQRLEDLVIYELHVGGLGLDRPGSDKGNLEDAIRLLDYLVDLGINAIGLMPMSEFQNRLGWGYSTSHYMAIEYSDGGRDQFKHFVRECHRRGIAVILDVVYNHYTFDAERAEWAYDSNAPERNIYYWYEGLASDYAQPDGGFIDNGSSGWSPRFWEEMVRKMFVSSAAALVSEFHFDGFRVDLTTAIHRDARLHADGRSIGSANLFGQKFLREWANSLHLLAPHVWLIAEDHSGWSAVVQPTSEGGLGFDATWHSNFYHHLIGDAQNDLSRARLLKMAGYGDNRPLAMTSFAGELAGGNLHHIVYHESHDEAGNSYYMENGTEVHSARTIAVAVNNAPLIGETRRYAEARVHFAAGMTLLGASTPLFFMGEEVGASLSYRHDDFAQAREDFEALRQGAGAQLFRFYADLIRLRLARPSLRSGNLDVVYVHDANRVLAFRRWDGTEELLVFSSLSNTTFAAGYSIENSRLGDGQWREIFNSDRLEYGGDGLVNAETIASGGGVFTAGLPANSVLVFQRQ
jgi:1,4-alpha-glucan branching enzyme